MKDEFPFFVDSRDEEALNVVEEVAAGNAAVVDDEMTDVLAAAVKIMKRTQDDSEEHLVYQYRQALQITVGYYSKLVPLR